MASTRSKVAKNARSNATLSMKDLTAKEKKAEKASAQRRANRRAGNAGLSSQRLNRMEAEAERNSRTKSASAARDARAMDADLRERAKNRPQTNIKGKGTMSEIQRMASKLKPAARAGARFLGPAGAVYTAFELLKMLPDDVRKSGADKSSVRGGRSRAAATESRGSRGRGDGAAEVRARRAQKKEQQQQTKSESKKTESKNYNVGKSQGGVSFNEAFRHFRNKGAKTFTWNGEKYTTKLKEEKKK